MSTTVKTRQDLYDSYKNEVMSQAGEFTDFSDGSMHDILAGALSTCVNEVMELLVIEFMKTFFGTATGEDLENLAVDHFGDDFARDEAVSASVEVTFSRANTDAGNVTISAGTIIKTEKDENGEEVRFSTDEEVEMTGLTISVNATAVNAGNSGNVSSGTLKVIESALTDITITVTNASAAAGGEDSPDDEEYREDIKNKIIALAGATEAAVKAAALAVPGVAHAVLTTSKRTVIDYDIATEDILAGATYFYIPYMKLYVSDDNGNYSEAMLDAVSEALVSVKAAGVKIEVVGASALSLNWSGSVTLNAAGPNYAELSADLTKIIDTMESYILDELQIGQSFVKASAKNYIMSIWGPGGTNDITNFSTSIPTGNVSVLAYQKLVPGTVELS